MVSFALREFSKIDGSKLDYVMELGVDRMKALAEGLLTWQEQFCWRGKSDRQVHSSSALQTFEQYENN